MNDSKKAVLKQKKVIPWIVAVQICFQYICASVSFHGISVVLEFVLIAMLMLEIFNHRIIVTPSFLLVSMFVILSFIVSMIISREIKFTVNYFERFIIFCMSAFLLGYQVQDKEMIIQKVVIIGLLLLPSVVIKDVMKMSSEYRMGYAYACLPILIASFIAISSRKIYFAIGFINIIVLMIKFINFAPRGILVIITIAFAFLLYWRFCIGKNEGQRFLSVAFTICAIFCIGLVAIYNFDFIIRSINDFLVDTCNIKVYALQKYLNYSAQGKIFNGRDKLWLLAWDLIKKRPSLGYGIGYYETLAEGAYCHNIILEALCEGGIVLTIFVVLYIGGMIFKLANAIIQRSKMEYNWSVFSFCIGLVVLFFSSSYWMYPLFWFFLGDYLRETGRKMRWNIQYEIYN